MHLKPKQLPCYSLSPVTVNVSVISMYNDCCCGDLSLEFGFPQDGDS